jgi:hypothetical protein
MWRRAGLVRIDVSEEHVASIFRVENIGERNVGYYKTHTAAHPRKGLSS